MDIAIVGAGLMGRWHSQTASKLGAKIIGIVDTEEIAANKLASHYPGAGCYASLEDLFSITTPDVVHICTPLESHKSLCLNALDGGVHVVCEKPLASSAEEVRLLYEHADRSNKQICPVHQFVTQKGVQDAKSLLDNIGKINQISFVIYSAGAEGYSSVEIDKVVAEILPHPFSVISYFWPGSNIDKLQWQYIQAEPGEIMAYCLIDDMPVSLSISMSSRPTRCYMEIQGNRGRILIDFFHGFCLRFPGSVSRFRKITYPISDSMKLFTVASVNLIRRGLQQETAYPGLKQLLHEFYGALDEGIEGPVATTVSIDIAAARDHFLEGMKLNP